MRLLFIFLSLLITSKTYAATETLIVAGGCFWCVGLAMKLILGY